MENFLNFCAIFYKFFKIFQKSFVSTFLLNVSPEPKLWRRHCSTKRERNSYMKFCLMSLQTKILAPPLLSPQILGSRKPHGISVILAQNSLQLQLWNLLHTRETCSRSSVHSSTIAVVINFGLQELLVDSATLATYALWNALSGMRIKAFHTISPYKQFNF